MGNSSSTINRALVSEFSEDKYPNLYVKRGELCDAYTNICPPGSLSSSSLGTRLGVGG